MFDDFQPSATSQQSRARFRNSMLAALIFYGTSSAAIVAATNQVRKIVEEKEEKVEFAPPPEPEPEPPPPPPPVVAAAPPSPRPKMRRPELAPPDKISDEKLKESNKALTNAGDTGPVDGFLTGTVGGTGNKVAPPPPPPPPPLAPLIQPAMPPGGLNKPRYSAAARRRGIEGVVVVEFDVLETGRCANPKIISGPPEFADAVLKEVVSSWHFKPASRAGKPVRVRMKRSIRFSLEDE